MPYIVDGIYYEEYPDTDERIETLRAYMEHWKAVALRATAISVSQTQKDTEQCHSTTT